METAAGEAGMWKALESPADLVLLEQNCLGEDGLLICRRLRLDSNPPVIVMMAEGGAEERILGLEAGADDFISKPFEPRELLARMKCVLRRVHASPPNIPPLNNAAERLRFAGWTIDRLARRLVDQHGTEVCLSGAEFRLLNILLDHNAQILSRDQLTLLMKGRDAAPFDRSIDLLISRLRQKLGDNAKSPQIIKTVRNEGYVIVSPTLAANA